MTRHRDVEQLMVDAIAALARRRAIEDALAALPEWQRLALRARYAIELLQRVGA